MRDDEPLRGLTPFTATENRMDSDLVADSLEGRRKKRRYAYLAWLCLGSHHLYLGRPLVQILFWLTLGGLLFWWVADLFRLPGMVERHNRQQVRQVLSAWREELQRPVPQPEPMPSWRSYAEPQPQPAQPVAYPDLEADEPFAQPRRRTRPNPVALAALLLCLFTAAGVKLFSPPPLYPRAVHEPRFQTLRQVNVRAEPSTASAIKGVIPRNVILRGEVEEVAAKGPTKWLRITRGDHARHYVALSNLQKL